MKTCVVPIICVCAVFLLLFGVGALIGAQATEVSIFLDGKLYARSSLAVDSVLEVRDVNGSLLNTVCIENGRVRVTYASCPDHICVNTGELVGTAGEILCLPNRVSVRLTGKTDTDGTSR